ncbi:hypothetical protein GCM10017643_03120 [Ancylobacter dichloromethanicus]|uniref:Uncharacterized protein n=1 Tax=Ancylobacter dichloromethanicus TaxID=518825 RepID=A0A9W6MXS5_9HYPH|nr:hypothetical protein GCM10017643_03120 [Ancylobacter dichloromethanicus]
MGDFEFNDEAPIAQHQDDVRYNRPVLGFKNGLVESESRCPHHDFGIVSMRNEEFGKRNLQSLVEDLFREFMEGRFARGRA